MIKKILFFLGIVSLLYACVDNDIPNPNGMWQLKTIEDEAGHKHSVDTIFYSFQRQLIFSYTLLTKNELGKEIAEVIYGYADYPDSKTMHIKVDKSYDRPGRTELLLWKDSEVIYEIIKLNSKEMILGYGEEKYFFIKF